jgi:WD40 repeat protein
MKFKKKIDIKKTNDNQRKSKVKREERKKKIEKKIIKKPKNIKKTEKKIINKPKNIEPKKETIKEEKNKDREINFEKITSFPYDFYFYKDLIQENLGLCSTFITFKSINEILTLVYVTDDYSIIFYDIAQNKQLNIIKNPQKDICNLQYCLDNKNKRDLVLSQSCYNNIKIWDINNYKCILDLKDLELSYVSVSKVCFMNYNNNIYIILSSTSFSDPTCKLFDLSGKLIKEINFDSNINYIITYKDDELSKFYILISTPNMVKSYNYDEGKTYHTYLNIRKSYIYNLIVVNKDRVWEPTHLFGNYGNYAIIWNFHTGEMLNNVYFNANINNICLWNNQFLIAIAENFNENKDIISLLDVSTGKLKKNLITSENCKFSMISKIEHPEYGEGLVALTQDHKIKLFLTEVNNIGFDFTTYLADMLYNKVKDQFI